METVFIVAPGLTALGLALLLIGMGLQLGSIFTPRVEASLLARFVATVGGLLCAISTGYMGWYVLWAVWATALYSLEFYRLVRLVLHWMHVVALFCLLLFRELLKWLSDRRRSAKSAPTP